EIATVWRPAAINSRWVRGTRAAMHPTFTTTARLGKARWPRPGLDETPPNGEGGGVGPVAEIEPAVKRAEAVLHAGLREAEFGGDVVVVQTRRHVDGDFRFSRGGAVGPARRAGGRRALVLGDPFDHLPGQHGVDHGGAAVNGPYGVGQVRGRNVLEHVPDG